MMRAFRWVGGGVATLLLAVAVFFVWASSGHVPDGAERQITIYDADRAAPRDTLRVMTYNIGYLSGMTNNRPVDPPRSLFQANLDRAEALIRDVSPDFIGFQEIDFGADRSYDVHQLDSLASRLGYASAAQATNWDKRYVPFPYWPPSVHFGRMHSGQAVAGRYPIESHYSVALVRPPRPFWSDAFYLDRLAQVVVFNVDGLPFVVINVHLEAFDAETRQKQARQVRALLERYTAPRLPVLLIGDFNSVLPAARSTMSPGEQGRFRDDPTMEIVTAPRRVVPAFSESRVATSRLPETYPADNPTRKIDYVLFSQERLTQIDAGVHCGPPEHPPADHCAVSMTFVFPRPDEESQAERRRYFDLLPPEDEVRAAMEAALRPSNGAPSEEE